MDHGTLALHLERILRERNISKNRICRDLDIPRTNFNRYCSNNFQRLDAQLLCKLCWYLDIGIGELLEFIPPKEEEKTK